ncbi:uncharacterized protein NECHADRAFT_87795 [Fusarium vanettenii 77-13-4]|uniref:RING-type domain-containing protein n=1 Tax=Fusarium vanettenii (strain ATCC MYA-4622 / CBS 123669 / FGSC 9596 / NRRL 45880 / 77-13-4) TaxID=660122 RepID=C7Z319_FUSV7|nr:uncharacterized protein NECHADRAFT_87795 [Fusarium vanettenii 77-13-4]EEU41582.1 hypothetical protein NECHADRAFT_87795 [Fusarium vanettenii 77-13-4]
MLCDNCWFKRKKHVKSEPGHEKTIPNDAIIVYSTLKVNLDEWPLLEDAISRYRARRSSQIGDSSEWFGVRSKSKAGDYLLVEGRTYDLMMGSSRTLTSDIYPGLVSFVGETGSGKSTLIGLLCKSSGRFSANHFKTPVVGDSESRQPTTPNVHLYADSRTFMSKSHILYAECEEVDGYEIPAQMSKSMAGASASSDLLPPSSQIPELDSQDIIWSKMPRNDGAWTRKEIARILFSRVLYIFSDVVVFPFIGPPLGDTISQLVKWGHSAIMHSYNKPILPSAIIAFFNRDIRDDSLKYGLTATKISPTGNTLGRQRSFSVVTIPRQVCFKSQKQRQASCMKWNTTTFPLFVRKAFTHFASKYETSFNFSNAWVDIQNFSAEFNWSLFNLARMARGRLDLSHAGIDLWVDLSGFVASCLFLKCARAKQADCRVAEKIWKQSDEAMEHYWMKFWPCNHRIQTPEGYQQCVNGPSGHPHHQGGKSVEKGDHSTSHSLEELKNYFRHRIENAFNELKARLKHLSDDHERLKGASTIHLGQTRNFYQLIGGIDKLISHLPCLVCLDGVPEHSLTCGHVICRECANAAGDSTIGGFVTLEGCPFQNHRKEDWPRGRSGILTHLPKPA